MPETGLQCRPLQTTLYAKDAETYSRSHQQTVLCPPLNTFRFSKTKVRCSDPCQRASLVPDSTRKKNAKMNPPQKNVERVSETETRAKACVRDGPRAHTFPTRTGPSFLFHTRSTILYSTSLGVSTSDVMVMSPGVVVRNGTGVGASGRERASCGVSLRVIRLSFRGLHPHHHCFFYPADNG